MLFLPDHIDQNLKLQIDFMDLLLQVGIPYADYQDLNH